MDAKKILVPIDLSTNSLEAIKVASSLAKVGGGEIVFLFVAIPDLPTESGYAVIEADAAVRAAQEELQRIKPAFDDIKHSHEVRRGDPASEIVRCAQELRCDMVVMTTHGRSGLTRLLMGSVAEHVIRHAPCPVLTLRMRKETTVPKPAGDKTGAEAHSAR